MSGKKSTLAIGFLSTAGVLCVVYGLVKENNPVFIAGIIMVSTGYGILRVRLKQRRDSRR